MTRICVFITVFAMVAFTTASASESNDLLLQERLRAHIGFLAG